VKDLDVAQRAVFVREGKGKGGKDRGVMLLDSLLSDLRKQLTWFWVFPQDRL
jgi:integrase